MKLIDFALILVILFTAIFAGASLNKVTPERALPVPVSGGNQPAHMDEPASNTDPNHVQTISISSSPVIQVTVGMVVLVFGVIACFPLFTDTQLEK